MGWLGVRLGFDLNLIGYHLGEEEPSQTGKPPDLSDNRASSQQYIGHLLDSSRKVTTFPLHPEVNHRPPTAAGKAVPVVTLGVDAKAWVVVVVERTPARARSALKAR